MRRCWSSGCAIGPVSCSATQAALVDAERFAAMGKTSAAIAHELKNSLNGLGMAVELIACRIPPTRRGSPACARRSWARSRACATWSIRCCRSRGRRASIARRPTWRASCRAPSAVAEELAAERGVDLRSHAAGRCCASLRRAQGAGRGRQPDQERDRGWRSGSRSRCAPRTARRSSRSPTTVRGCRSRRGSTCSSRSSPPSRTAPGWGCRPRAASSRRTAGPSRPRRRQRLGGALFRLRLPLDAADAPAAQAAEAPRA